MIWKIRLREGGKTSVPSALREQYDLQSETILLWRDTGRGITVEPTHENEHDERTQTNDAGRGLLVPEETSEEKRREVAAELCRRMRQRRRDSETE
jgi:bifunctional DNA-binding transcriptional regulator/antitoxin component of YhaV-PrlF toxin-antitoxin module